MSFKIDVEYIKKNWVNIVSYSIVLVFCVAFIVHLVSEAAIMLKIYLPTVDVIMHDYTNKTVTLNDLMQVEQANFITQYAIAIIYGMIVMACFMVLLGLGAVNEILRTIFGVRTEIEYLDDIRERLKKLEGNRIAKK